MTAYTAGNLRYHPVLYLSVRRHTTSRLNLRFTVVLLFIFSISYLFSCPHGDQIDPGNTEVEIWELQLTGGTQGNLNIL